MESNCCFNPKVHIICKDPVIFECQTTNDDKSSLYVSCLKCICKRSDYSGRFKCPNPNCLQHKRESILKEEASNPKLAKLKNDYLHTVSSQSKSNINLLKKKSSDLLESLKEKYGTNKEYVIQNYFSFMEDDLGIRVESVKIELEKLEINMLNRIDRYKLNRAELIKNTVNNLTKIKANNLENFKFIDKLKLIHENISSFKQVNQLQMCEDITKDKIKCVSTKNRSCKVSTKLKPVYSKNQLPIKTMIGYLSGISNTFSIPIELVNKPTVTIIDLRAYVKSCCGLTEIYDETKRKNCFSLAISDFADNSLNLLEKYDSYSLMEVEWTQIRQVKETKFKKYYAICTDSTDKNKNPRLRNENMYVCDMELQRVLIFDSGLSKLKKILSGTGCNERLEFSCPRDICYYNEFVYVLDQGVNSIDKFTRDGDFVNSFYFNQENGLDKIKNPWSIRVSEDIIGVVDWKQKIFVYDFSYKLKCVINVPEVLSFCFMENSIQKVNLYAHCENGDFLCYKFDQDPILIYKQNFNNLKSSSEFMIYTSNQKFVLSLGWAKSLALVEFW